MGRALMLNASFEPLCVVSARRAVVLVLKEKAEIVHRNGTEVHAERMTGPVPSVIRLRNYVSVPCASVFRRPRRAVCGPLGVTGNGAFAGETLPPNTAIGYTRGDEDGPVSIPLRPNTRDLRGRGSTAGGGWSTAQDLRRVLQALRERRIPNGLPAGMGIAGGSGGMNAIVEGALPGGYDLIVLANLDPPAAERVARMIRDWLGVKDGDGGGHHR